jgi:hypothetical protein
MRYLLKLICDVDIEEYNTWWWCETLKRNARNAAQKQ